MSIKFATLGSGSSGNAGYLEADGFGVLIDLGFGPRQLEDRMVKLGVTWAQIKTVLLTHTHRDHWNDRSFSQLHKRSIPVYCHQEHQRFLSAESAGFSRLRESNLVLAYEPGEAFQLMPHLACLPFGVRHDSGLTCGFRFDGAVDFFGEPLSLIYASDLGTWDRKIAQLMANVDLLAVEFNHDVQMQRNSRRSSQTIARNLGNNGHLSNKQAAALVEEVIQLSVPGRLQHVVQLHVSKECNEPKQAVNALRHVLDKSGESVQIITASQDKAGPVLIIGEKQNPSRNSTTARNADRERPSRTVSAFIQPMLPGLDG